MEQVALTKATVSNCRQQKPVIRQSEALSFDEVDKNALTMLDANWSTYARDNSHLPASLGHLHPQANETWNFRGYWNSAFNKQSRCAVESGMDVCAF